MKQEEAQYRDEEQPEEQRVPLTQVVTFGGCTFLAAGAIDMLAHLGPTGLVVGGIVAYVASQHGPELLEQVRGALPARPSSSMQAEAPRTLASQSGHGGKGSGKTGAVARLAEQFAPYCVSEVLFDIKGDLGSLVTDRRPDGSQFVPNGFAGRRGRAPRGRSLLRCGLQVVYDLRTWQTPEQAAGLICAVVEEMLETVALTPEGELAPCLVFLDEAEYWLPQSQPSYLSGHTYKRLLDAFHTLATMGRSRGLAPVIATQRIAKVNKDIIAQAEMNLFMKATLDIDLDRYYDYFNKSLVTRERIRGFEPGEAVVCLPDGSQSVTRLYERESRHHSHTPHITAGLAKFAGSRERGPRQVELDDDGTGEAAAGYVPSADQSIRRVTMPPQAEPPSRNSVEERRSMPVPRPARAHLTPELEQALAAWNEGASSVDKLEKALGITHHHAYKLYRQLRDLRVI